ncbi:MAG: isochorismatase family protein [Thermoanaerobaculales bacterium]|jgi:nicotinamidase-related amidase|nr:isochorismatase family protein [Thermoanaerobaculales bacterium]
MRRLAISTLAILVLAVGAAAAAEEAPASPKGKPALVVMDIQNAYLPMMDDDGKEQALRYVNYAISKFRERGLPVIVVYHTDPDRGPAPGSEGFEFPAEIRIADGDARVVKNRPSAFVGTELETILRDQGCDTVFLVGLSAVGCVLRTYFDAERLEFRTFMIEGALLSHDAELTRAVEAITGAVRIDSLEYMLLNAPR